MSVEPKLMTAEDLWRMPEVPGKRFELVDGELIEMPGAGGEHMMLVVIIFKLIDAYVTEHNLGIVFPDGLSYIMARDPDRVRIPDVSFVSHERVPEGGPPQAFWPVPPNLAVEVVSPHDNASQLHEKVRDYLAAGVQAVWIVWPASHSVSVHEPGGASRELGPDATLDGGDVLPGFSVTVEQLFEIDTPRDQ